MTEDLVQKMMQLLTPEQKQELAASLLQEDKQEEVAPPKVDNVVADDFTMTRDKPKTNSTQIELTQLYSHQEQELFYLVIRLDLVKHLHLIVLTFVGYSYSLKMQSQMLLKINSLNLMMKLQGLTL